ncbi:NAD(P)/FAD-dependent oxidoreductase [Halalkalibacterium halodurans]|uniref:BH1470 protein n=1 Tax=Halalkalibacterium halodurans (strain ATCC BAA-125 / DSM 18197 / FERM 7344 / JCM 9153 / C-125) TaxID=272558 RepID=Q9KCU9_HALH5|nr:NAD(P)/FAD-dependent oxidoreductase [Halalkalibacterium halodurans]MED4173332.1 NAD(P)/FAD-dependent oxidoreductase [Halalkalibacterium halodurans]BAB05189.1 BH1470 [Halalkalibacterium halodurans C-125]
MNNAYDVIIVGAGPAGIFTAYELLEKQPTFKLLLIDKGHSIYQRRCPINEKKIEKCPPPAGRKEFAGCLPACSITAGFGGAGAYSDGKFNITTEFGGWMQDYLPPSEVLELIQYVDAVNLKYGAPDEITDPTTEAVRGIEKRAMGAGLKLLRAQVRHLGTEKNLEILKNIYESLEGRLEARFRTEVEDLLTEKTENGLKVKGVRLKTKGEELYADQVVIVPGRDGSEWLGGLLKKRGLTMINNQVDIGVRVETSDVIMEDINRHLYEAKFIYNTSVGTKVRTFCSNPSGHVVVENHSGVMTANGHAYKAKELGSRNTNFALLVSHTFTEPFDRPIQYAKEISERANDLSNGSVIVQKYGDILRGRRSTEKRIKEGFIEPTLKEAVPGDLGLVLPYNTMKSLIEMMEALDHVTPGIASEHTLFYGVEAKFYSARPQVTKEFETEIAGLYAGGDGAGITRGLAQAGANGVHIARAIIRKRAN